MEFKDTFDAINFFSQMTALLSLISKFIEWYVWLFLTDLCNLYSRWIIWRQISSTFVLTSQKNKLDLSLLMENKLNNILLAEVKWQKCLSLMIYIKL